VAINGCLKAFSTPPHLCCQDNQAPGRPTDLSTAQVSLLVRAWVPHTQCRMPCSAHDVAQQQMRMDAHNHTEINLRALHTTQAGMLHSMTCLLAESLTSTKQQLHCTAPTSHPGKAPRPKPGKGSDKAAPGLTQRSGIS
jgi:hypothetical protein